jgi:hypothetical protein
VDDKNNIEQFNEANSPVRLIEPDQAWAAMKEKLDGQRPVHTKAPRHFQWKQFFAGTFVVALVTVGVYIYLKDAGKQKGSQKEIQKTTNSRPQGSKKQEEDEATGQAQRSNQQAIPPANRYNDTAGAATNTIRSIPVSGKEQAESAGNKQHGGNSRSGGKTMADESTTLKTGHHNDTTTGYALTPDGDADRISKTKVNSTTPRTANDALLTDRSVNSKYAGAIHKLRSPVLQKYRDGKKLNPAKDSGRVPTGASNQKDKKNNTSHAIREKETITTNSSQLPIADRLQASTGFARIPVQLTINVPGHLVLPPAVGTGNKDGAGASQKNKKDAAFRFIAAVQWAGVMPVKKNDYYVTGPGGSNQLYRHLLPAVVLTFQKQKHKLDLRVSPFLQVQVPDTPYYSYKDTMSRESKSLVKLFGYGAGLHYAYNLYGNWWVGAGIQGNWWRKGLVHHSWSGLLPAASGDSLIALTTKDTVWIDFSSFQLKGDVELWYDRKWWGAGLQCSLPFIKPVKNTNTTSFKQPVAFALILRLKLFRAKM